MLYSVQASSAVTTTSDSSPGLGSVFSLLLHPPPSSLFLSLLLLFPLLHLLGDLHLVWRHLVMNMEVFEFTFSGRSRWVSVTHDYPFVAT